jgi:multimeric flavodoxin WrbA
MRLLLTDTPLPIQFSEGSENYLIDLSNQKISHCVGCFGCWVKTPGKCVIRDDATKIYPLIAKSEEVVYVSRVKYGSYDTPMKTMLERAIPVQQAFLRIHHGETHHVQRAVTPKKATLIGYGELSADEKEVFKQLVQRNSHNMSFEAVTVKFSSKDQLFDTVKKEVQRWERS